MFRERLLELASGFCRLSAEQVLRLHEHYELLVRWNRRLNLTRIEDLDEAVELHYAESLFLGASLPSGELRIADVGSGGGFPGFPVAVLRPECKVILIESHQRKAVFLKEASRSLANVTVVPKRAEDVHQRFDWVISRAVSYSDLTSYATHLAPEFAVLGGELEMEGAQVRPLPWGVNRRLLMFHVKQTFEQVSRETPCDRI